ncbi:MFS transporter, partial [Arthrobacter deserti]|nr:MFS transporter [Arthrobacter deserti]
SLLGWAGGLFFGVWGWAGVALYAGVLALAAGAAALLALRGAPG